ncbi:hypothetical protein PO909_030985 [Leuciscus waleckii]
MTLIGQMTVYQSDYVGMEVESVQDLNAKIISLEGALRLASQETVMAVYPVAQSD